MGKNTYNVEDDGKTYRILPSQRLGVAGLGFLSTLVLYMNRVNMGIALVCMTEGSEDFNGNNTNVTASPGSEPEFDWDSSLQGFILSSFFIGYLLTQIPTGWIIPKYKASAKWLLLGGNLIVTLISFLSPTAARGGWGYLVALQILKGMASGVVYPSLQQIITLWAAPSERSRLNSLAVSGAALGSVITFASSGFLCDDGFAGGWPSIFYTYAICALVWAVIWIIFVTDNPGNHHFISEKEKNYIEGAIAAEVDHNKKKRQIPWLSIFTSLPFWAIVITDFGYQYLWHTSITLLPRYFNDVLDYNIAANGLLNSLPYIANLLMTITASLIADFLIKRFKIGTVRKMSTTVAMLTPTIFVIATGFLDPSQSGLAVAFLTISVGALGFTRPGHTTNQIDIAPRFGAIMMGLSNSAGTLAGIISPIAAGNLTPNGTQEEWRNVFFVAGGLTLFGEIVFVIFGSGEVQPWAMVDDDDDCNQVDDIEKDDIEKIPDVVIIQDGGKNDSNSKMEGSVNSAYSNL